MGPIGFPATSVANYQHMLPDVRQELRPPMYSGGSLKSIIFEYLDTTWYGVPAKASEIRATFCGAKTAVFLHMTCTLVEVY